MGLSATAETGAAEKSTPPALPIADHYRDIAGKIIGAALANQAAYEKLTFLADRIGHRLSGSKALEQAIDWAARELRRDGHEQVAKHKVMVPHWERGSESAHIVAPARHSLRLLGLGGTVGTPNVGVTGEVVVVQSFDELKEKAPQVKGRIVLFNARMPAYDRHKGAGYGETVRYRTQGPSEAAKLGAVASLVRSVTAFSMRTPHTGTLRYAPGIRKIPAAAISTEDADLIARLTKSGQTVRVNLKLGARWHADKASANVIAELRGNTTPSEVVVIGAHIDSWDVGQGAHDDGAGCVIVMQALTVLRHLGLIPKRTIRVVLFTNEENGLRGAMAYAERNKATLGAHVMALEADTGGFAPRGWRVNGSPTVLKNIRDLLTLAEALGAMEAKTGYAGADIGPLTKAGVPGLGLWMETKHYFDYHHTEADTLDKVNPKDLAKDVALVALTAYVVADMPGRLTDANPMSAVR